MCDLYICNTYRASAVTHSHITFDVERWRSSKTERFHVRIHLSLIHIDVGPRATEAGYQFVIDRATGDASMNTNTIA